MSARRGGARRRKGVAAMAAVAAMVSSSVAWAPWADAGPSCKSRKVGCPTDTVRPTVSVSSPASGATVAGTITVAGTASDDVSVSRVDVSVDGVAVGRASGTTSWSIALDTTRYANGSRTISAVAVDSAGNTGSSAVTVTVQNAVADTVAPSIAIASPAAGATLSGAVSVGGSAADDQGLGRVEVAVDGAASTVATGTTSWSAPVDTRVFADGSHTITATAVDTSGNRTSRSVAVTFANATPPPPPSSGGAPVVDASVVTDPKAVSELVVLGRGRIATAGTLEVLLYREKWTTPTRIVAHVTDTTTNATSLVDLPSTTGLWTNAVPVLTTGGDLWILAADAPVVLRHYRLSGSPLPTSATFVSSRTFGDGDSRMGAMIQLASGAVVAVWHQQGAVGPQGHGIAYRRSDGSWHEQFVSWSQTSASKDALVQHPADGSVWLLNNSDSLGTIAAAHLTEVSGSLRVDWTDWSFIGFDEGQFDADPSNPDIVAVPDPSAGDIVLAYQSAVRQRYSSTVIGSYPAIARVAADGRTSFTHLPVWAERISWLGLSVRAGEVWLAHRVVNPADLSTDNLELRVLRAGAWSEPAALGRSAVPLATPAGASFAFNSVDGSLRLARAR